MSKNITISAIGAREPNFGALPRNWTVYEKEIIRFLEQQLDKVLPDKPDLIVFPECANRYIPNSKPELKEYYRFLGDRIVDFLKPIAIENNTNIAYSAVRYIGHEEEKPFRNSTVYIDRSGNIAGIYNKNHLVIEENTLSDVKYGTEANVIGLDFGKVATAICFDLNFDELLHKYQEQAPDLIVHCSMYHGGRMRQAQWAYTCRSYFVGAICGLPCSILNPFGDVVAESTNYTDHVSATINLDYKLCHIDYNWEKFAAAKRKYKDALTVYDPGLVGSVMLSYERSDKTVDDIITEFEIERLDDYFNRARAHRNTNI